MGWKRVAGLVAAGVGVVLVAGGGLVAWTFSGMAPIPDGATLGDGVRVVRDGYVAAFVVPLADGTFALVDAGNDPAGEALLAGLAAAGGAPDRVSAILLTHAHPDHVAACARFPGATTYAAHAELPIARGEEGVHGPVTRWFPPSASGCPALTGVDDGATLDLGGTPATLYTVPGHTAGSAAWSIGGVLFLGDSADAASSGSLLPAKWVFTDDPDRNRRALRGLAARIPERGPATLAFAHSGPLPAEALWTWAELAE